MTTDARSVTEVEAPADCTGSVDTIEAQMVNDPDGTIFIQIRMGREVAYFRPRTFEAMGKWFNGTWLWRDCVWDRELNRCINPRCHFGSLLAKSEFHGRLEGPDRVAAVRQGLAKGKSPEQIAVDLGWTMRAIRNDLAKIRSESGNANLLAFADALESPVGAGR